MAYNRTALKIEIQNQPDVFLRGIKPLIQKEFKDRKQDLLDAFEDDQVTQEIEAGPEAMSWLVKTEAGGNLFSLLGFEQGSQPIQNLREILENISLGIQYTRKFNTPDGIGFETPVNCPSVSELNNRVASKDELEWSNKAWTALVEQGVPWFAYYLYDDEREDGFNGKSRSGTAIQVKTKKMSAGRASSMPGIPYMSKLLKDFRDSFSDTIVS